MHVRGVAGAAEEAAIVGAGSKSRTRRDISVRGATYNALRARVAGSRLSVDALAERIVVRALADAEARDEARRSALAAADEIASRGTEYHRSAGAFFAPE